MQYVIVGILNSYGDAEAAVEDLELAGIVGQQVEVISDIDEDARTANTPGEASTKFHEPHRNWIGRLFGAGGPLEKKKARKERSSCSLLRSVAKGRRSFRRAFRPCGRQPSRNCNDLQRVSAPQTEREILAARYIEKGDATVQRCC